MIVGLTTDPAKISQAAGAARRMIADEMAAGRDASAAIRVLVPLLGDDYVRGYCDGLRDGLDHPQR